MNLLRHRKHVRNHTQLGPLVNGSQSLHRQLPNQKQSLLLPRSTIPSGPTTARKAGAAAKGVAEGLAVGLGTELAIGFVAGATGVAASTICLILLPFPIYAIATHWDEVTATASRLYQGKGTLHDFRAAGEVAGGLLSIGAAGSPTDGSATDVGIEAGQTMGEALRALSGNESEEEVGVTRTYPPKQSFSRRALMKR